MKWIRVCLYVVTAAVQFLSTFAFGSNCSSFHQFSNGSNATSVHIQKAVCLKAGTCTMNYDCLNTLVLPDWTICLDDFYDEDGKCLVYSVGIAQQWMFDVNLMLFGCEVHMFDPTVTLPANFSDHVFFHKWGLYGGSLNDSVSAHYRSHAYGKIDGEMKSVDDIQALLGHKDRTISIFKIDCEGCEWEVFGNLDSSSQHPFRKVKQMLAEFHFSTTLGVGSVDRFGLIGRTFDVLHSNHQHQHQHQHQHPHQHQHQQQQNHLFPFSQFFYHKNDGWDVDRNFLPDFIQAGASAEFCCSEVGYVRVPCAATIPFPASRASNNVLQAKRIFSDKLEGMLVGGFSGDKEIFFVGNGTRHSFLSLGIFTSYGYDFEATKIAKLLAVRFLDAGLNCCSQSAISPACFNCTVAADSASSSLYSFMNLRPSKQKRPG